MSAAKENPCRKFQANIFNKSKCQNCFKPRESHLLNDEDLSQAKPIYGGWLLLAPDGTDFDNPVHRSRKWQRRFFILYEHGLLRYALDEMPTTLPQGTINMNQCTDVVDGEGRTGQKFSLCILTPEKEHFIRAENKEIISGWLEMLMVYPRTNKQNQKKKRKVEPPTPQEPGPAKMAVTSSSSIPSAEKVPTTKSTLWQEEMRAKDQPDGRSLSPAPSPGQSQPSAASTLREPGLEGREEEGTMSSEQMDCGRKVRVESGYFSLEKTKQDLKAEEQQLPPPLSPPSPSTPSNRRSQVIEKFEALDIEKAEHMETSAPAGPTSASDTRQGRSEKRVFPRKRDLTAEAPTAPLLDVPAPPLSPHRRAKSLDRRPTEPPVTPDLLNFKKGWLTKQYEDGQWKKHWFVLADQSLRYYRDSVAEEAADLDGEIDLATCYNVTEYPVQRNYGFQIHPPRSSQEHWPLQLAELQLFLDSSFRDLSSESFQPAISLSPSSHHRLALLCFFWLPGLLLPAGIPFLRPSPLHHATSTGAGARVYLGTAWALVCWLLLGSSGWRVTSRPLFSFFASLLHIFDFYATRKDFCETLGAEAQIGKLFPPVLTFCGSCISQLAACLHPPALSSLPEEKSKSSSPETCPRPSEKQESDTGEPDPDQRRSRARERRREGRSKTFDWAEFRPIQQALAQERASATGPCDAREPGCPEADPGELERERTRRREERRRRFGALDTVDGPGGTDDAILRMEVDRSPGLPVTPDLKTQSVHVEIEQRWHQVETTPLREEKQVPISPLHLASSEDGSDRLPAQELTSLLEKELEQSQKEASELLEQNRLLQDQLRVALGREQSAREGYVLQATCERGFAAMEETHQKKIEDLQRQHQRELEKLREEKDRLLAEETAATISAIEAMKNAHREEMERELEKSQRSQISSINSDIEALRRQYLEELQSVQRELEVLSEQYSQKCLENAHLAQALEAERQALRQCQRENQELNAHNQELNNRLAAEITRLRTLLTGDGGGEAGGSPLTQGKDAYELEVLLRVKESEIQYLKQEISSLKDELQTALRDKKYASDKYKDIYTELSIVKAKADCDISRLKEQLKAATEALGEKSPENTTVSGYDIMKSKSNPDFLKKDRSCVSRQLRNIRSKSLKEGLTVQERLKLFESRDLKKD
nr:myosin phosphatase Rho-interacting protein [Loxodonta africana]